MANNPVVHDNGAELAAMLKEAERPYRDAPAAELVDAIGQYDARIAALADERELRANELKARGAGVYVGQMYECNVYEQAEHFRLDTEYVRAVLARYIQRRHPKVYAWCFERVAPRLCLRADARHPRRHKVPA